MTQWNAGQVTEMLFRTGLILNHIIFTLEITDMAKSHGIKIKDNLCNYYKWLEVTK